MGKKEIIFTIVNVGFADEVMDRARKCGVKGGTIIHGRGNANKSAEQFFDISFSGEKEIVLYGNGYIEDILLGVKFKISSKSFYQVNPIQTATLYSKAIEFAKLNKTDRILDTYCGIGTIGLIASKNVEEVIGVEIVSAAIKDAKNNALLNNIDNIHFVLDDASNFMVNLAKTNEKMDVVFVDPPRKGCDEKFLNSLMKLAPEKIIYISCNPSTLARDLYTLKEKYEILEIQPVDMFPHTFHIETVVSLKKK